MRYEQLKTILLKCEQIIVNVVNGVMLIRIRQWASQFPSWFQALGIVQLKMNSERNCLYKSLTFVNALKLINLYKIQTFSAVPTLHLLYVDLSR